MEGVDAAAFLDDFVVSEDTEKPITSGLFRLEKGNQLTYTYTYHEMKLDKERHVADAGTHLVTTTALYLRTKLFLSKWSQMLELSTRMTFCCLLYHLNWRDWMVLLRGSLLLLSMIPYGTNELNISQLAIIK